MRLIIARHAETHKNKEKILQGSGTGIGSPLTDFGVRQADALCNHLLQTFSFDAVIVSPAKRTLDTALPLKNQVILFYEDEAIKEIDCGSWEGKSVATLESVHKDDWDSWKQAPLQFTFPDGESIKDVSIRTSEFLKELHNKDYVNDVLLVSHSATISTMIANILELDLHYAWENGLAYHKNAEYSVFNFDISGELLDYSLKLKDHLNI